MGIHAYYPRKREAYGHRGGQQYTYVEGTHAIAAADLVSLGSDGPHLESRTLPCGGQRWYAFCTDCGHRCQKVYPCLLSYENSISGLWLCRRCAGLTYWSQYDGRRIEADRERIFHYLKSGGGAIRTCEAFDIWLEREAQHNARAWASMAITQCRWERFLARCRAMEQGEIPPKLSPHDRAEIIDLQQRWHELSRKRKQAA